MQKEGSISPKRRSWQLPMVDARSTKSTTAFCWVRPLRFALPFGGTREDLSPAHPTQWNGPSSACPGRYNPVPSPSPSTRILLDITSLCSAASRPRILSTLSSATAIIVRSGRISGSQLRCAPGTVSLPGRASPLFYEVCTVVTSCSPPECPSRLIHRRSK